MLNHLFDREASMFRIKPTIHKKFVFKFLNFIRARNYVFISEWPFVERAPPLYYLVFYPVLRNNAGEAEVAKADGAPDRHFQI